MLTQAGKCAALLAAGDGPVRRAPEALRLTLTGGHLDGLAAPEAWAGLAEVLGRAADPDTRFEVALPESQDLLLDVAVRELNRQGLRFLQLTLEPAEGGNLFVVQFLPARPEAPASRAPLILREADSGRTWELTPGRRWTLGRGAAAEVQLVSPQVSARHCTVHFARRAFAVRDLGSSTGTMLDNVPVRRAVVDESGLICLGHKPSGQYVELELQLPPGDEAVLVVLNGVQAGQALPLPGTSVTVGRGDHCPVRIDAPFVSWEHLRLTLLTDCFLLRDLASLNGTLLNGKVISSGRLLPGDRLTLGDQTLEVHSPAGLGGFFQPGWQLQVGSQTGSLDRPYTTVGRDPGCDFSVPPEVGLNLRHARLVWEPPDRLWLHDLGSRGGVWLGEQAVSSVELQGGEAFRLGPVPVSALPPE